MLLNNQPQFPAIPPHPPSHPPFQVSRPQLPARLLTVAGVVFQHVFLMPRKRELDKRVVNGNDMSIGTIHGMTENNASNAAKSVNADFDNHLCFVSRSSNLKSEGLS